MYRLNESVLYLYLPFVGSPSRAWELFYDTPSMPNLQLE